MERIKNVRKIQQRKTAKREIFFTDNHEWIEFRDDIAYIGVCPFKLTGFGRVHEIDFLGTDDIYKQGEVIATLSYRDYTVNVYMPVNGLLKSLNTRLYDNKNTVLDDPEANGWLAIIIPSLVRNQEGLLTPEQYRMKQHRRQWG